jgi:excisionase family DNA binding protein
VEAAPTNTVDLPEPLLIPDTAAAALAGVSRATWQRLRAAGKLPPAVRLGRKVLWRREEIAAWIAGGCPDMATWAAMQAQSRRYPRAVS